MRISNYLAALVLVLSLGYFCFSITEHPVSAQESATASRGTAKAIRLYNQGDTSSAIKLLSIIVKDHPDDADAWYYLGLAFYRQGIFLRALPAFESLIKLRPRSADAYAKLAYIFVRANALQKAVTMAQRALELGDQSAEAHYAIAEASLRTRAPEKAIEEADKALGANPHFTEALITKSFAQYNMRQYPQAAETLESFLAARPDDTDAETWRGQVNQLRKLTPRASDLKQPPEGPEVASTTEDQPILRGRAVTQRARILSKPEPAYTEAARKAGVSGTVIIKAVFASDGEVKQVLVTSPLACGLTTAAVKAARRIKFTPAMKDGRPVSIYMQMEYSFSLF